MIKQGITNLRLVEMLHSQYKSMADSNTYLNTCDTHTYHNKFSVWAAQSYH